MRDPDDLPIFQPRMDRDHRASPRSGGGSFRHALLSATRRGAWSAPDKIGSARSRVGGSEAGTGARRVVIEAHVHRDARVRRWLFVRKEPLSLKPQVRHPGPVWLDRVENGSPGPPRFLGRGKVCGRAALAKPCVGSASSRTIRTARQSCASSSLGRWEGRALAAPARRSFGTAPTPSVDASSSATRVPPTTCRSRAVEQGSGAHSSSKPKMRMLNSRTLRERRPGPDPSIVRSAPTASSGSLRSTRSRRSGTPVPIRKNLVS